MTKKTRAKARRVLFTLSLVLVVAFAAVGGTIAWLTDTSQSVVNTFTSTKVVVELEETKTDFEMVPGNDIEKDPKVSLGTDSEDAWVFVELKKSTSPDFDNYLDYTINDGWELLSGTEDTSDVLWYGYKEKLKVDSEAVSVLQDDKVTVKSEVTTAMMGTITGESASKPTLTITAAAVQAANITTDLNNDGKVDVKDAWIVYNNTQTPTGAPAN